MTLILQPTLQAFHNRRKLEVNLLDQDLTTRANVWTMDYTNDLPFNITFDSVNNRSIYRT